jgi:hypothetical protein
MRCTEKLAVSILVALGLPGTACAAGPIAVTDCSDSGAAGTLRTLLGSATDGDQFDTSACSTITLTQGELPVGANVTVFGSSSAPTTIDANHGGRVFNSSGDLALRNVTLTGGRLYVGAVKAFGGCVYAKGAVSLFNTTGSDCIVRSDKYAAGGGIAADSVSLVASKVDGDKAYGTSQPGTTYAGGGGISAKSAFSCVNGTISGNKALAYDRGEGGGVWVNGGSVYMLGCTVDNNVAQYTAGVLQLFNLSTTFNVINSTISGNVAKAQDGSLYAQAPMVVSNSTIAFNYAAYCGGMRSLQNTITLYSTIVARNLASNSDTSCGEVFSYSPIGGSHNIITVVGTGVTVPGDTLSADPRLSPLADRGGLTRTHGLALSSLAIDAGINTRILDSTGQPPATDQRGTGHDRVVGAAADIGAYERQVGDDELFADGFD